MQNEKCKIQNTKSISFGSVGFNYKLRRTYASHTTHEGIFHVYMFQLF